MLIEVKYGRRRPIITGYAYLFTNYCQVNVPKTAFDPCLFAAVVAHEVDHCRGLKHKDMPYYGKIRPVLSRYEWAKAFPIRSDLEKAACKGEK
jgi:hypothetical protein